MRKSKLTQSNTIIELSARGVFQNYKPPFGGTERKKIAKLIRLRAIGKRDSGFSGWSKAKAALDEKLGESVAPWRVHDLRRTCASGMQRLGVRVEIIERALNHVSGSFRGVAGVYRRDPMTAEVKDALNRWARHVMALVGGRKAVACRADEEGGVAP